VRKVSSSFQVVATTLDAADVLNRAGPNPAERCEDFRNEWRQILHAIGGRVLVKQYAHVSEGFRARARELQWPVRVERTETA